MALSASAQPLMQVLTFSAAASTLPAYIVSEAQEITCLSEGNSLAPTGSTQGGAQFITVFATLTVSGSATIAIFAVDNDSVGSLGEGKFFHDTAVITATAIRQSHNTAAGDFMATVVFAISGKNTLDVHPGSKLTRGYPKWYATCTGLTTSTALKLLIAPGRAI